MAMKDLCHSSGLWLVSFGIRYFSPVSQDMQPLRSTSSLYLTRVPGAGALDTHRTLPRVLRARRFGAGHVRHGRGLAKTWPLRRMIENET